MTLPVFQGLKREHPDLANMHFHLPDGRSFLRMHRPDEHGDDLRCVRPMIAEIHRDGRVRDGYEFGVHGLFYRVAEPVVCEGQYIGALEFGIRPDALIRGIETILGVEIVLHVAPGPSAKRGSDDAPGLQILPSSVWMNGPGSIFRELSSERIRQALPCEVRTSQGRFCVYRATELTDFRGNGVGLLLLAQNIDEQISQYRRFLAGSFLATAGSPTSFCV